MTVWLDPSLCYIAIVSIMVIIMFVPKRYLICAVRNPRGPKARRSILLVFRQVSAQNMYRC